MTLFDLLFILLVLATVIALLTVLLLVLTGKRAVAASVARYLAASWGAYMTLVVSTSTFMPQRVLAMGEPRCFDDWCIAIMHAEIRTEDSVEVSVEISSQARRVVQRENGIRLYLIDDAGHRYNGAWSCGAVPLDAVLSPGEQQQSTCRFELPRLRKHLMLAIGHQGGFPIRWFIVGEEAWFRPPTIVPLPLS